MSQSRSVIEATISVLGEDFQPGVPVLSYITKSQVSEVVDLVTQSICEGLTDFSAAARVKYNTPKLVRSYVVGMVNNWHRKSKELNGGMVYTPKNPGSRQGSSDPELKELKLLKKTLVERNARPDAIEKVDAAIQSRLEALGQSKPKVQINADLIPEELRDLI
jgi:hypothetical protein